MSDDYVVNDEDGDDAVQLGEVRRGQRLYLHPHAPSMGGPCLIVSPKL